MAPIYDALKAELGPEGMIAAFSYGVYLHMDLIQV